MKRGIVIAGMLLVALGLWFVLTWNPAAGEDPGSAVERIRRGDYPPGARGLAGQDTWALDDAPDVSPDSTGKRGGEAVEGPPPPSNARQGLVDGGPVDVLNLQAEPVSR